MSPQLSVVAPAASGLPVAYGVCEALQARQVSWAERERPGGPLRFRPYLECAAGEKVLPVDGLFRTGCKMAALKALAESNGAHVVGIAVMVYQPSPGAASFGPAPFYYLARLDGILYQDAAACELCKRGVPLELVRR